MKGRHRVKSASPSRPVQSGRFGARSWLAASTLKYSVICLTRLYLFVVVDASYPDAHRDFPAIPTRRSIVWQSTRSEFSF